MLTDQEIKDTLWDIETVHGTENEVSMCFSIEEIKEFFKCDGTMKELFEDMDEFIELKKEQKQEVLAEADIQEGNFEYDLSWI